MTRWWLVLFRRRIRRFDDDGAVDRLDDDNEEKIAIIAGSIQLHK